MSLAAHIGIELPLHKFGTKRLGVEGHRLFCPGAEYIEPSTCSWYGCYHKDTGENIPFSRFTLCKCCALSAFSPKEVYPINQDEFDQFAEDRAYSGPIRFQCDMHDRSALKSVGYLDRKVTCKNGMQISINQVSPTNADDWCPAVIPYTEQAQASQKNGVHVAKMVSHSGWEMVLRIDPEGMYNERDYCFRIEKIVDGAGRKVNIADSNGISDFYTPASGLFCVRGYSTGSRGDKFFFVAPTKEQKEQGDIVDHHGDSCKFFVTVSIHKKQMREVYRGCDFGATRGGATRGGATRGWTRGFSQPESFNGGTNFSGGGYNPHVQTQAVDATFPLIDRVELAVQLVNRESEDELHYSQKFLDEEIVNAKKEAIDTLKRNKEVIKIRFSSSIEQKQRELEELKEQYEREIRRSEREIELKEQEYGFIDPPPAISYSFVVVN